MTDVDCVVVGAGVVGLAIARKLSQLGREVLVLEQHDAYGTETSARNSEVIHAGIYYPTGSNKARWCVAGKAQLYAYCQEKGIPHNRCGKVIVAVDETQQAELRTIYERAIANEAGQLKWLTAGEVQDLEPAVRGVAGLWSESTGIIDSHAYMLALLGDAEATGATLALNTRVKTIDWHAPVCTVQTAEMTLSARWVVNSAGLAAAQLAAGTPGAPAPHYARGRYYTYTGRAPFSHLVYPVPEPGGLGVHVTLDMAGQARFGPDVEWIDTVDYTFDDAARPRFVEAIKSYFPDLDESRLQPGYTGVRPKISGPGEAAADFRVEGPATHGVPGLVNLLGIESPGLTASLAIADVVGAIVSAD